MRVRQYAFFVIKSQSLAPSEITGLTLMEPDEARHMGSRSPGPPPLPRSNSWVLKSGVGEESDIETHLVALLPRLRQAAAGIKAATDSAHTAGYLTLVRRFEEGDEDFDEATYGIQHGTSVERLSGQHPFLGWGLEAEVIEFLGSIGVGIDVDEYG